MRTHIILPQLPTLVEEISPKQAVYAIEPLNPGYGVTLANSIRRVMLSSLEGSAVTYYKIKGVDHEFSTVENILEDVVDITLNIKTLRFVVDSDEPVTLSLKSRGSKVVTGAEIDLPTGVTLVNPEAMVLTLTDPEATLDMELTVEKGYGFRKGEHQMNKKEVGLVAVDSVFTPIVRVSYDVQDMRVGDQTNYNRVVFSITTDGTISPLEAIQESSRILVEQFTAVVGEKVEVRSAIVKEEETEPEVETSQIKIETLEIAQRTIKALEAEGVENVAQLLQLSRKEIVAIKGISEKAVQTIEAQLETFGITLE